MFKNVTANELVDSTAFQDKSVILTVYIHPSTHPFPTHLSIHPPIHLPIHLPFHPPVPAIG